MTNLLRHLKNRYRQLVVDDADCLYFFRCQVSDFWCMELALVHKFYDIRHVSISIELNTRLNFGGHQLTPETFVIKTPVSADHCLSIARGYAFIMNRSISSVFFKSAKTFPAPAAFSSSAEKIPVATPMGITPASRAACMSWGASPT